MLLASARAVPGCGPHEVGAGFVDGDAVPSRLGAVTGCDVVRWFGIGSRRSRVGAALDRCRVFDREGLGLLAEVAAMTGPAWRCDYRRGRVGWIPVASDALEGLAEDERAYGVTAE